MVLNFYQQGNDQLPQKSELLMQLVLSKKSMHEIVTSQLAYFLNGGYTLQLRRSAESCEIIDQLFYTLHDNVNRMRNYVTHTSWGRKGRKKKNV